MINRSRFSLFGAAMLDYSTRTIDLVERSLVIDMLGLLTLDWGQLDRWQIDPESLTLRSIHQIRDSGITVFHPAVELDAPNPHLAVRESFQAWNYFLSRHTKSFLPILVEGDFAAAKSGGRTGILLGAQNSSHFRKLGDVNFFHGLGQRVSLLTYNSRNSIGCGCTANPDRGLTSFGASVVARMNAVGMAVDVSHSGDRTTSDAIEASRRPVLISHSNPRALVPGQPRCKSDATIRKMAARGGVIGLTKLSCFTQDGRHATLETLLDQFDHVIRLAGIEHVGIGSDTDLEGRDRFFRSSPGLDIDGLDHPKRIYDLTEGLVRRGYTDRRIELVLGGNFRRALSEIWRA